MQKIPLNRLNVILNNSVTQESHSWPSLLAIRAVPLLKENSGDRVLAIVDFLDSMAAFLGSILISIYINDPEKKFDNKNLNQGIFDFLNRPTNLGKWIEILRHSLEHFKNHSHFFIPELMKFASGINDPFQSNKKIYLVNMKKSRGLLDELNSFRLCVGHPGKLADYLKKRNINTYNAEDDLTSGYELAFPIVLPDLVCLIHGLKFLSNYWFFFIKSLREKDDEKTADIYLYSSSNPYSSELRVENSIHFREFMEDKEFDSNIFRFVLFLAKIKKDEDPFSLTTSLERIIEVNPVLINWLREKSYLPHRFTKWRKKKKKQIMMSDILFQEGESEIVHEDTRNRLWNTYMEIKNRLSIPLEEYETEYDEKEAEIITLPQSEQRYKVVFKEIYPHLNIANEILADIEVEKEEKRQTFIIEIPVIQSSKNNNNMEEEEFEEKVRTLLGD